MCKSLKDDNSGHPTQLLLSSIDYYGTYTNNIMLVSKSVG